MLKRMFLLAAAVGLFVPATRAAAQEVVVIVNVSNATANLSVAGVRAYFLKTSATWSDGEKVRPVDRSDDSAERNTFLMQVLGMSAADVERYWIEKQYATAATPPTRVSDDASVIRMVQSFRGAIGFVSKAAFDAANASQIKAILTVGS